MSKIGDLFVRLGLKSDDFHKGMQKAGSAISGLLEKLKGLRIGGYDVFSYIGKAVGKFIGQAIQMTQKWGDQWDKTMAGINAAYGVFIRQLSSGEGFDNLFANMREAARLAREAAEALDEIFERKTSYGYGEAITNQEIARLRQIMQDSSKSDEERKKAADAIIQKEKELANIKRGIAQDETDAYRKQFKAQTNLNDNEIDFLVKEFNQNRDIINQGRKYLEDQKKAQKEVGRTFAASMTADLEGVAGDIVAGSAERASNAVKSLEANTSQAVKDVAAMLQKYDKANDELVTNLANADIAVINVDTDMYNAQRRATTLLGTLNKVSGSSGSTSDPGAETAARILKRAQDSAKNEIQLYYEKYQEEKALLEQYNLDTTALTQEYFRNINGIIEKGLDDVIQPIKDLEPIEVDLIDMSVSDYLLDEFIEDFEDQVARAMEITREFREAVIGGFSDGCQELMSQLMGLRDFNAGAVVAALLDPLADMAVKQGEILIAQGLGVEACKKALESLNGYAAIAAGVALISIGAAAKAGLAALASGGSATTSASTYSGASGGVNTQNVETEMTIYVEGRISGSDIVISGQKTVNAWNR
jgi:hypothetical protein